MNKAKLEREKSPAKNTISSLNDSEDSNPLREGTNEMSAAAYMGYDVDPKTTHSSGEI